MIFTSYPQQSDGWFSARKGVITGSRFKDCRSKLKTGKFSQDCIKYAQDVARERCGGSVLDKFQNQSMKIGTEQEPLARSYYESVTGNVVLEVGFVTTDDGRFGCSPDGLIGNDGVLEIKTMVSSQTLFTAVGDGDISAYRDQCLGYLWLMGRKWVDLVLWAPDLEEIGRQITIIRIERDEDAIAELEADLMEFERMVNGMVNKLLNNSNVISNATNRKEELTV